MNSKPKSKSAVESAASRKTVKVSVTELLQPLPRAKQKSADEIEFTQVNAAQHLATLLSQVQQAFDKNGEVIVDRLRNVAHW